jgi:hypothetical protein
MPHYSEPKCGVCHQLTSKVRLYAKKVVFTKVGSLNTVRSRTRLWICNTCLEDDPDWNAEAYSGPGHTSPALERIEERRAGK